MCLLGWLAPVPWGHGLEAQSAAAEYQIKAVFLFNFAQFVDWPASAFPDSAAPIIIGVLGNDPFGRFLDETVRGETVRGHPLQVQRYRTIAEVKTCHILFINSLAGLEDILGKLKDRAILTVGDDAGFARRGGMIRFVSENRKIRMRINLEAASAANLTISSKLLRAAEIVTRGKP